MADAPDIAEIPALCLATNARLAARALTRAYDAALRPHGLRVTQFSVLVAAALAGGRATITQIAEALGLERSSLSRALAPLERDGLVRLGPETRHRARHVHLTEAGRARLEAARPAWAAVQEQTADALGADPAATARALRRLASAP